MFGKNGSGLLAKLDSGKKNDSHKEQVEKRLSSSDNVVNKIEEARKIEVIIKDGKNHSGRIGSHNLSDEEKVEIE